ncbi:Cobalamin synthase [Nitrospira sp. KM1]|uniref:adenosylcobinamide-GDP ribazoletransferase n=1 Tax=Nitrospira sp. KM1 TaxID=1936990 RepID=UPI0013A77D24|nr:adenosylcobinamide-GDP ribazoletransferase [Nitrospira sp. KM1]BCA53643.1 Cobalamin synthase [Nitrospira sp. KM1]
MTAVLRPLLVAWQFLTAIPLSRHHHDPMPGDLAASMMWYPLVGFLLGAGLAVVDLLMAGLFPREVTAIILMIVLVAMTRGLHQDGLADTFDGLAGGRTFTERLTIMRDPRIGAIGGTGLCLSLLLRYATLVTLPDGLRTSILLCMPAVGRWSMASGAYGASYARPGGGLAAPFLDHLKAGHLVVATISVFFLLAWSFGIVLAVLIVLISGAVCRALTFAYVRYFGGITGDTLGATNEIVELVFLVSIPVLSRWP